MLPVDVGHALFMFLEGGGQPLVESDRLEHGIEERLNAKKPKPKFGLFLEFGAGDESRTRDLNLGKVALYQLSYSRILLHFFLGYLALF